MIWGNLFNFILTQSKIPQTRWRYSCNTKSPRFYLTALSYYDNIILQNNHIHLIRGWTMKKVAVLSTGGTIAGIKDGLSGLVRSGKQTGEQLLAQCDAGTFYKHQIDLSVHTLFQIPSNHMNFSMCLDLIRYMHNCCQQSIVDGFVILHGTDCPYSFALQFIFAFYFVVNIHREIITQQAWWR